MYKNELKKTKPFIFEKKLRNKTSFVSFFKKQNTLVPIRYFPPANQEWFNSLYSYNNIYAKNITIADKNFSRLIKSYFNLYFSKKLLYSKHLLTRFKRISINKIFLSRAELKHTASKVIITLYVYNEEKRILLNRLKVLETMLFTSFKFSKKEVNGKIFLSLQDKINVLKKNENLSFDNSLKEIKNNLLEEIKSEKNALETIKESEFKIKKLLDIQNLNKKLKNILSIISNSQKNISFNKNYAFLHNNFLNKTILEREIIIVAYYKLLLNLNKYKFEDKFISKLKPFIKKIYNKEAEFNIVNTKAIYLKSDIFTQVISLKLRNRNNRLLKVLSNFLYLVKLPKINPIHEQYAYTDIKSLWINKVKDLTFKFLNINAKRDSIDQLLKGLFGDFNFTNKPEKRFFCVNNYNKTDLSMNLINHVLDNIKHKKMAGVRLEAKGRLTRRLTASRSVFKIKWKGSLKNIYSSYRGLSSVILRGHAKSNVNYSIINSKTRNGAFGLKGWISGK